MVHVSEVRRTIRGPEIVVSRASRELLRRLFEMEVPEVFNGIVEIKAVAREAGSRSKVAVHSRQEGVDPVGSCVGLRGIRIQNIVNVLQGEKIDVVQWHPDPAVFLANALSPCPVTRVELGPEENMATVVVPDRQLSLAIGREGQNARLCARLSGLMVNIKSVTEAEEERLQRAADASSHAVAEDTAEARHRCDRRGSLRRRSRWPPCPSRKLIEEAAAELEPEAVPVLEARARRFDRGATRGSCARAGGRPRVALRRPRPKRSEQRSRRFRTPCGPCHRWPSSRREYDSPRT